MEKPFLARVPDNSLTKMMQTASLHSKGQKHDGPGSGVGVIETTRRMLKMAPVGLQEGAGGLSFTVVCFPVGMHSCPRVRGNYTAAVTRSRQFAEMKT